MSQHVIFVAPFFLEATLRFLDGTTRLPGIDVTLISQDPVDGLPSGLRSRIAGHYRVPNALDPAGLVDSARRLQAKFGKIVRMFGPLEQLQLPLALAREALGIDGPNPEIANNFRDKARMKDVLRAAGVPCARHVLATDANSARAFAGQTGFPLVVKPLAGAGGKSTYRVDDAHGLETLLERYPPRPGEPTLFEEFVRGTEHSFDSVLIDGRLVWHSISRYMPSPLEVLENDWIQWCVVLPRDIDGFEYDPIREAATNGLAALGLSTGLSHMEWFRLMDGQIAVSEAGARPPGAQITSLLSYAHDFDFYRAWPQLMVFDTFAPPRRRYAAGAAYIRGQGRGRIRHVAGLDEAQARYGALVVEARLPTPGQPRTDSYEGDGYVIVRHPDTTAVEQALTGIISLIRAEAA
jgi:hypothetical protein